MRREHPLRPAYSTGTQVGRGVPEAPLEEVYEGRGAEAIHVVRGRADPRRRWAWRGLHGEWGTKKDGVQRSRANGRWL